MTGLEKFIEFLNVEIKSLEMYCREDEDRLQRRNDEYETMVKCRQRARVFLLGEKE